MKKRLFSLILAFALLLSAVPTVFAATHHEVVIDGVVYWVYPEEGYAEIHSTVKGSLPQVLEIPQYVNGYPVTRLDTFGLTDLEGVVGVILPDTMTFIDHISIAGFDLVFVSLPNNEVNIEKNFVGAHALDYYYLPQNFSLSPECSAYGSKLFASHTCVGYEKHRAFASDLIPMDAHPDSQYVPANSGVFRVDGNELNDTLDYDFYTDSKSFHLKARVADGIREWDVRREERGPFGCDFSTYLGDQKHSCSNHCMFCFIDQLPPGMRESLYFKDDDERLSFLFGNYITMTNMQDHEIDRIIKMHISPINISVHTTNPQLRVRMLANKRGGEVLKYLPRLVEGGIAVNCQLVLCRGINDGDELRRTLSDLLELTPMVQSIAAVPCGVTDYREKLFKQTPYDAKTSAEVIDIMEEFGDECKRRHGKRIIYPSDEWYLKAGRPIPPEEFYEDFDQLENGVGMMRLYASEFLAELEKPHRIYGTKKMDVVTGEMASPLIHQMMAELHRQYPMVEVTVHTIKNKFFGGNVGVAGLVTATDIIAQCEGKLTSGTLGVPAVMLREEKDTFLDDITTDQLAQRLGVKVEVLPTSGGDEARALLRSGLHIARRRRA